MANDAWHSGSQVNPKQMHTDSKMEDTEAPRKQLKGKERLKAIFLLKKGIQQLIS